MILHTQEQFHQVYHREIFGLPLLLNVRVHRMEGNAKKNSIHKIRNHILSQVLRLKKDLCKI